MNVWRYDSTHFNLAIRCRWAASFTYQYRGTHTTAARDDVVRTDELPLPAIQTVGPHLLSYNDSIASHYVFYNFR
jgi:hypothetical protein